jgi:DNA modification methylase/rubredoxin
MGLSKDTLGLVYKEKEREEKFKLTKEHIDMVRHIEGFPIAKDEDIIELSDPPYYTACPNPFLQDFIDKYGKAYDPENDDYHREPFASDVSEGKKNPIYNAHSYHTKVPHKAIMRYILHYTEPGDIVYDGFCGTGMTGVAAQLCGDKAEVESLGYKTKDGKTIGENGIQFSTLGSRKAILADLSPAATFIAYNYNSTVDVARFQREAERIFDGINKECGWMYETKHLINGKEQMGLNGEPIMGRINYTVWSDVFTCPECSKELIFWEIAVDKEEGKIAREFECPFCNTALSKRELERVTEKIFDRALGETVTRARQEPVLINYEVGGTKYEKSPDSFDIKRIDRINGSDIPYWFPKDKLPTGDKTGEPIRLGITHAHHFYTKRSLWVLSSFLDKVRKADLGSTERALLCSILTGGMQGLTSLQRYRPKSTFPNMILSGTLYIGSLRREWNALHWLNGKFKSILRMKKIKLGGCSLVSCNSCTSIGVGPSKFDYIFTDPPFGGNLMYSELNFLWEAWLRVFTNNEPEAIENRTQKKRFEEYRELMEGCFKEYYYALKPGRWMTVVFHNSQSRIWNAIQESIQRAGFIVADVSTLDKQQGSFNQNQIGHNTSVKQDLVISAYKPSIKLEQNFSLKAGTEESVWAFVEEHLKQLPVVVDRNDIIEIVGERQDFLLFDRMVAFHIERGIAVPMGSAEFYAGLRERYHERDGMFFLPEQVRKYDGRRVSAKAVGQLSLFVNDEKAAIQWLRLELEKVPATFQEIQPKFLKELRKAKHEKLPELLEILEENFLSDDEGKWYVPDPNKQSDLEKIRERSLLKEFATYKDGKGRLREFRLEAVRAGFKDSFNKKDYQTILRVAKRIPEKLLQEDITLLMYHNNAAIRIEE